MAMPGQDRREFMVSVVRAGLLASLAALAGLLLTRRPHARAYACQGTCQGCGQAAECASFSASEARKR